MKLTPRQREVIEQMQEGCTLNRYKMKVSKRWWLRNEDGNTFDVSVIVAQNLRRKELVKATTEPFVCAIRYRLTQKGKEA